MRRDSRTDCSATSITFRHFPFVIDDLNADGIVFRSHRAAPEAMTRLLVFPVIKNRNERLDMTKRRAVRQNKSIRHQQQLSAGRVSVNAVDSPFKLIPDRMEMIRR